MNSLALMQLWDALDSPEAEQQSQVWHRRAYAAVQAAGTIESYMRPSPTPGLAKEDGGKPGAGRKQVEAWEELRKIISSESVHRIAAISGSNQCSKSTTAYVAWCKYLRDEAPSGSIHWLIAASIDSIKGIPLRLMWELLPRSMFGSWSYHPQSNLPTTLILRLPNDRGHIEVKPMTENQDLQEFEQERLTSWLWSECRRQAILGALQPRMVAMGAFGIMDYIPVEPWHRDLEEDAKVPGGMIYHIRMSIVENQHNLAPGAVRDMKPKSLGGRGTMSVEEWKLRGLGIPAAYEGVVFKQFDPDTHVVPAFQVPDWWPLYVAGDWGYRNAHAILLATVAPNEQIFVMAEEYDNETTVFDCCRRLWNLVSSFRPMDCGRWKTEEDLFLALRIEFNLPRTDDYGHPITHPRPVAAWINKQWTKTLAAGVPMDALDIDQADGAQVMSEFWKCGFPATVPKKSNKHGSVELVRRYLEQKRLFLFAGVAKHRRDLMTWRYKEGKDRVPDPDDRFERKNDHGCASVMYLLRSSPCHNPAGGITLGA